MLIRSVPPATGWAAAGVGAERPIKLQAGGGGETKCGRAAKKLAPIHLAGAALGSPCLSRVVGGEARLRDRLMAGSLISTFVVARL